MTAPSPTQISIDADRSASSLRSLRDDNRQDASASHPAAVSTLLSLASKMIVAQLAPLIASLYVAGLIASKGAVQFSAYSLVNTLNLTVFVAASSFLQALYFVGGQAIGQNRRQDYRLAMQAGLVVAVILAILAITISASAAGVFSLLRIDGDIIDRAWWLGFAAALGIAPAMLMVVYRVHAALNERAGFVTMLYVLGSLATVAIATLVATRTTGSPDRVVLWIVLAVSAGNWLVLAAAVFSFLPFRDLRLGADGDASPPGSLRNALWTIWHVGWPIGAVVFLDSLATLISTLITGRYWLESVPVHSVVWLWVMVLLVVPLGLAQATVQRVALTHARQQYRARNLVVRSAILLAALYGLIVTAIFSAFPVAIGSLLLTGSEYEKSMSLLAALMPLGGIALGLQAIIIVGAAALRGIGLTRAPLIWAFVGYCIIASGGQYLFGIVLGHAEPGIWWGLIAGFAATSAAVVWRCVSEFRYDVQPIVSAPALRTEHPVST